MNSHTLQEILGSRDTHMRLRVLEKSGNIDVVVASSQWKPKVVAALKDIADFLRQHLTNKSPSSKEKKELARLLWGVGCSPLERLACLTRIAVALSKSPKHELSSLTKPGMKDFHSCFVALPDGTAFSLRLLLGDDRKGFFKRLPDPLLLWLIRETLKQEAQMNLNKEAKAKAYLSDKEFANKLNERLKKQGIILEPGPTENDIQRLRERDKWKSLFPNKSKRKQADTASQPK